VSFTATRWGHLLVPGPAGERTPTAGDCYRFVLMQPEVDVVIAGPANGAQLREAIATVSRGPMAPDELAWIRGVGDRVYAGGGVRANLGERF
jgi:predicted aldo/keto reductase-like oxidoreductase